MFYYIKIMITKRRYNRNNNRYSLLGNNYSQSGGFGMFKKLSKSFGKKGSFSPKMKKPKFNWGSRAKASRWKKAGNFRKRKLSFSSKTRIKANRQRSMYKTKRNREMRKKKGPLTKKQQVKYNKRQAQANKATINRQKAVKKQKARSELKAKKDAKIKKTEAKAQAKTDAKAKKAHAKTPQGKKEAKRAKEDKIKEKADAKETKLTDKQRAKRDSNKLAKDLKKSSKSKKGFTDKDLDKMGINDKQRAAYKKLANVKGKTARNLRKRLDKNVIATRTQSLKLNKYKVGSSKHRQQQDKINKLYSKQRLKAKSIRSVEDIKNKQAQIRKKSGRISAFRSKEAKARLKELKGMKKNIGAKPKVFGSKSKRKQKVEEGFKKQTAYNEKYKGDYKSTKERNAIKKIQARNTKQVKNQNIKAEKSLKKDEYYKNAKWGITKRKGKRRELRKELKKENRKMEESASSHGFDDDIQSTVRINRKNAGISMSKKTLEKRLAASRKINMKMAELDRL
jgi:hypothetical protein